jgi:hypothetical protein
VGKEEEEEEIHHSSLREHTGSGEGSQGGVNEELLSQAHLVVEIHLN